MCLIVFAYDMHPDYRLVLAANRDEFFTRPTASAQWWPDAEILAGRDLQGGGSWLGVDRQGRLAAVTNVRNPRDILPGRRSRGEMVPGFLSRAQSGPEFVATLDTDAYPGFNLILFDGSILTWHSNRAVAPRSLPPGLYALSNAALDTPWPKVRRAKKLLAAVLAGGEIEIAELFALLADTQRPAADELPETGVGLAWEQLLAPIFIRGEDYGTRCSTVVLQLKNGETSFSERNFEAGREAIFEERFTTVASPASALSARAFTDN